MWIIGAGFSPGYAEKGYFFVNYTSTTDLIAPDTGDDESPDIGDTVIARFQITNNLNMADASSEEQILVINQPDINHNGGVAVNVTADCVMTPEQVERVTARLARTHRPSSRCSPAASPTPAAIRAADGERRQDAAGRSPARS